MKYLKFLIILIFVFSCKSKNTGEETANVSKTQVSITHIKTGNLHDYLEFSGKTIYLNKNSIVAPISGYVSKVSVHEGDKILKGQTLFEMQSPEAFVMQQNDSLKGNYGLVKIHAPVSGIITGLNVTQNGVFSDQGSELCMIVAKGDLKVQTQIPFEYMKYTKIGIKCKIILPDSSVVNSAFSKILPQMDTQNQTMKVMSDLNANIFIPEEMIVKVLIDKGEKRNVQILPKSCVMTDALMTRFWVLKLLNDSLVKEVEVKIGNQTHTEIEIISPQFKSTDRIISEGAYGLSDSSLVEILR